MAGSDQLEAFVVRREGGEAVWFLGTLMQLKAGGKETGGAFGLIEQVLPAGFRPPPHVHTREDEGFYIIEGRLAFSCGDRQLEAGPGSFVFLPRGIEHTFEVTGEDGARLVQLNAPAGLEQFFMSGGDPASELVLPPPGPPAIERVVSLAPQFGVKLKPPPGH